MQKLMRFAFTQPLLVIALVVVLCALAVPRALQVRLETSSQDMMTDDPAALSLYDESVEAFGSDRTTTVFVRDKDLFTPEKLTVLDELVYQLEEVSGVERVQSIFSASHFSNVDGSLESGPLINWLPETQAEADTVRDRALQNPLVRGSLVSDDGHATSLNLTIHYDPDEKDFYGRLTRDVEALIVQFSDNFEVSFQVGNPYFLAAISQYMLEDQMRIIPLSFVVLVLTLIFMTRSLTGAILPIMTSGVTIVWTLAFMQTMGIPVNILTMIVPSLIIVVGSTEDIHLLAEYFEGTAIKSNREFAVKFMISKMGIVVFITALTTFLGFATICVNRIEILRQFGMAAAFGLLANPIATVCMVPVYLRFFGPLKQRKVEHKDGGLLTVVAASIARLLKARRKTVIGVLLGFAFLIGLFGFNVRLDNGMLGMFREGSEIRQRVHTISKDLSGVHTLYLRIWGGYENAFKDPKSLQQVVAVQEYLDASPSFESSMSLADFLIYMNSEMNPDGDGAKTLPESKELVSQYLVLMQDKDLERYVSPDFSEVNIVVRHNMDSSHEQSRALADLDAFVSANINPHFKHAFTGEGILVMEGADLIAEGQAKSIALLLVVIFIIMSILFVNVKAGAMAIVPNIFPIAILFGVMGLFGIPLNIGTAMVSALAIGIAVDDTVHFMTRYNREMRTLKDQDKAMEVCLHAEIRPVMSTSLALAMGFGVLAVSQFVTIAQFGMLSAMVMIVALVADLFLTAPLLSATKLLTLWDMMGLHVNPKVIEKSEFFRDLKLWQIKKIILMGRMLEKSAGEHVYKEWDDGDSLCLILSGQVRLYAESLDGTEVALAQLGVGDVFGQTAMLDPGPRSTNARAETDLEYVEISQDEFRRLHKLYPHIASRAHCNLARILGHRLAITNLMYTQKAAQTSEGEA